MCRDHPGPACGRGSRRMSFGLLPPREAACDPELQRRPQCVHVRQPDRFAVGSQDAWTSSVSSVLVGSLNRQSWGFDFAQVLKIARTVADCCTANDRLHKVTKSPAKGP